MSAISSSLHHQTVLEVSTQGKSLVSFTPQVRQVVAAAQVKTGICTLFVCHTSASLLIQENADPDVLADLETFFAQLVPEDRPYRHSAEGRDDMPAHIRSALTHTSESIPVVNGRLALGTWQGIYLWEHRRHCHRRQVVVHVAGI